LGQVVQGSVATQSLGEGHHGTDLRVRRNNEYMK
jgi:hypothetical protein